MRCTADPSKPVWVRCMTKPNPSTAPPRAARDRVPDAGRLVSVLAAELRYTERAITFWRQKASECGGLPPSTAFELFRMSSARFAPDSPLEESGFEPSVPLLRKFLPGCCR